ncbi:beta-hexosaminidase [Rhodanobacter thiooxydans]|uniref:beta-N-acetylhexosaminidase n=1 Tax=Rhodanobacter thiooxydans TaxID=416169 RepID=A0A154QM96_9GAMM|nr:family 20 glycosylhydrolase [Rhodanobacter thiooxydans]EIL97973.1 beta-N-acetylhexosaminidase [Rhodanobacter thiooxydans LCS2]KZC24886.1 beta-hexosaminidase [Rhodanobacter thiooxydans]MCW0202428.1 family 20 glycosylhydrolase [Rhodanobacter thiooxydans]
MTRRLILLGCASLALGLAGLVRAAEPSAPALLPLPAQLHVDAGRFTVDAHTPIVLADDAASTRRTGAWLTDLVARTRGLRLPLKHGAAAAGAIVLQRDPAAPVANREGYALDVTPQGIRITARDDAGLFYGAVTLWQLLTPDAKQGAVEVPALSIRDQPRFDWRGLMLDSVRHFQSVAEIERLLEQMAQHKLNTFHWHLTDDQGWRIQIKRYPELTRIGAWRTPPGAGRDGEPQRYGGFYTQAQIRRIVAYAAARQITVVPEIDMPGHAQAAVAAYPQFGVTGQRPPVSVDWGINPYLYNVDDATFEFIGNVLDEVMALFPSTYIHVGGDEAIKDQWQASPAVQAKMRALGITREDALQGWFIDRVGQYLDQHGCKLVGWDEILDGDKLPADATVMSWRGTDGAIKAAMMGHDVVMAPAPQLYFDHVQGELADEYAGRLGVESLQSVYAFPTVPAVLGAAQARHVLGVQANVWTEHMPTMAHVEHAVFPRLDALSEVTWSPPVANGWPGFLARLPPQFARYRAQHVAYADSAFAVDIDVDRNVALATGNATVTLASQTGFGVIHYTLDGSTPTPGSPRYDTPFNVTLPATVRAASFAADGSVLAAPRQRVLDRPSLLSLPGTALANCPGSNFRLRLQPTPDAQGTQPVYAVNVFDACQLFPPTLLNGVGAIRVEAVRLPRNFALAHEQKLVVARPHATPFGELVVHADTCAGAVLASMPLPDPVHGPSRFELQAQLPAQTGERSLCLVYTVPIDGPLYAIGNVALTP